MHFSYLQHLCPEATAAEQAPRPGTTITELAGANERNNIVPLRKND